MQHSATWVFLPGGFVQIFRFTLSSGKDVLLNEEIPDTHKQGKEINPSYCRKISWILQVFLVAKFIRGQAISCKHYRKKKFWGQVRWITPQHHERNSAWNPGHFKGKPCSSKSHYCRWDPWYHFIFVFLRVFLIPLSDNCSQLSQKASS